MNALETTSTRPYLIRALHEWCTDNGFTPYIAVRVDETVQVPMEYVNNGEIVLNVGFDATGSLQLGNDYISFKARFGGVARDIMVPVGRVIAIYAREIGQGMAFPPPVDTRVAGAVAALVEDTVPADHGTASALPAPEDRVVQLVPGEDGKKDGVDDAPRPPPASGGTRPALKRIK